MMLDSKTLLTLIYVPLLMVYSDKTTAQLLHNPFQQPLIWEHNETKKTNKNRPVREDWFPQLRATMRSGQQGMANIDGNIIKVGEKIDGFVLVEVRKRNVIFLKDGLRYDVSMDQESRRVPQE